MAGDCLFDLAGRRVYVAGDRGMVGQALVRRLADEPCTVLTAPRSLDLRREEPVNAWFAAHRPDVVILAAARVGGIEANRREPVPFLEDNLAIALNVIRAAAANGVAKLLNLGSSCIYPRDAAQPIAEEALLTGPLEPTNRWYAVAKIAGLMLCQAYREQDGHDFISAQPTNLYGPGDTYDLARSHVLPALIARMEAARLKGQSEVVLWGTGTPLREFLHVDDLADACVFLLRHYSGAEPINVGSGDEVSIAQLARLVAEATGFSGTVGWNTAMPDGTPRKRLDCSRLHALGWHRRIALQAGLHHAVSAYRAQVAAAEPVPK